VLLRCPEEASDVPRALSRGAVLEETARHWAFFRGWSGLNQLLKLLSRQVSLSDSPVRGSLSDRIFLTELKGRTTWRCLRAGGSACLAWTAFSRWFELAGVCWPLGQHGAESGRVGCCFPCEEADGTGPCRFRACGQGARHASCGAAAGPISVRGGRVSEPGMTWFVGGKHAQSFIHRLWIT